MVCASGLPSYGLPKCYTVEDRSRGPNSTYTCIDRTAVCRPKRLTQEDNQSRSSARQEFLPFTSRNSQDNTQSVLRTGKCRPNVSVPIKDFAATKKVQEGIPGFENLFGGVSAIRPPTTALKLNSRRIFFHHFLVIAVVVVITQCKILFVVKSCFEC